MTKLKVLQEVAEELNISVEDLDASIDFYDRLMRNEVYKCSNISHPVNCDCGEVKFIGE